MDLTSVQWSLVSPILVPARTRRGRPPRDAQSVLNGIFWVLRAGARWADLPNRYPPHQTCHRRFQEWLTNGTLFRCFRILAEDLNRRNREDLDLRLARAEGRRPALRSPAGQEHPLFLESGARKTWRWHTALLLQSPLARQALKERQSDQIVADAAGSGAMGDPRESALGPVRTSARDSARNHLAPDRPP